MSQPEDREILGVSVRVRRVVEGQELCLNGVGVRTLLLFKVYVAALYVAKTARNADALLSAGTPVCVELVMRRPVSADTLRANFHGGLRDNVTEVLWQEMLPAIKNLDALIHQVGVTHAGDRLRLECSRQARIVFNDHELGVIGNSALARHLPYIWLGQKPAQETLKQGLLAGGLR